MNYVCFLAHWKVNEKLNTTYVCDCTKNLFDLAKLEQAL